MSMATVQGSRELDPSPQGGARWVRLSFWRMADRSPAAHAPSRGKAAVSLAIGVIGIAGAAVFVRWSGVSGIVSAFYRLALASLVLVPWRLLSSRRAPAITPEARRSAIVAGILFGADLA